MDLLRHELWANILVQCNTIKNVSHFCRRPILHNLQVQTKNTFQHPQHFSSTSIVFCSLLHVTPTPYLELHLPQSSRWNSPRASCWRFDDTHGHTAPGNNPTTVIKRFLEYREHGSNVGRKISLANHRTTTGCVLDTIAVPRGQNNKRPRCCAAPFILPPDAEAGQRKGTGRKKKGNRDGMGGAANFKVTIPSPMAAIYHHHHHYYRCWEFMLVLHVFCVVALSGSAGKEHCTRYRTADDGGSERCLIAGKMSTYTDTEYGPIDATHVV